MKNVLAESLEEFRLNETKDQLVGGKGDGLEAKDVDPREFLVGTAVEYEHSKKKSIAQEIALDHLAENPKYYSEGMEKGIFDEPAAMNVYKKYFIDDQEIDDEDVTSMEEPI